MINVQRRRISGVSSVDTVSRLSRSQTTPDLRSTPTLQPPPRGARDSGTPTGQRDKYPINFSDVWWLDRHGVPIPSSNVRIQGNKSFRSFGRLADQKISQTSSLPSVDSTGRARSAPKQRPLGNIRPPAEGLKQADEPGHNDSAPFYLHAKSVGKSNHRRPNSHEGASKRDSSEHVPNAAATAAAAAADLQQARHSSREDLSKDHKDPQKLREEPEGYGFNSSFTHRDKPQPVQANGEPKLLYIKDHQYRPHRPRRPSPAANADKNMRFKTSDPKGSNARGGQYTSRGVQPMKKKQVTSRDKIQKANLSMSEYYSVGIEQLLDQKNRHLLPSLKHTGSTDSLSMTVQSDLDVLEWGDLGKREGSSRRSRSKRSVRFNNDPKVHEYEAYDGWDRPDTDTYFIATNAHF